MVRRDGVPLAVMVVKFYLCRSCEKQHRQAKYFRNLVFIALASWSADLSIGVDETEVDNEEEDDGASTLSDGSETTGSVSVPSPL